MADLTGIQMAASMPPLRFRNMTFRDVLANQRAFLSTMTVDESGPTARDGRT
jgi:hypothetical protein